MGLEAINFAYVPPESKKDMFQKDFSKLSDALPKIGSEEERYIIKNDEYLIDFLFQGGNLSVRVALCCSRTSVERVFEIFKSFSQKYDGGYLKVVQSKQVIKQFTDDDLKIMLGTFEERRKVFVEHIADIANVPLSSDEVFQYIRKNNIKPKADHNP